MRKINLSILIFVLFQSFNLHTAFAYDSMGSVSAATGGTGVGTIESVDGALTNPASVALFPAKQFSFAYSRYDMNISMADNGRDALFPAALGYTQKDTDDLKSKVFHLILAYPFYKRFAFGVDAGFRELKTSVSNDKYRQTVISAGLSAEVNEWLTLGLLSKNKALNETDLPDQIDQDSTVVVGMSAGYADFANIRFDVESGENQTIKRLKYKTGLETYINDWIITRIGYQNDNVHSMNFFTAGLGFKGPQFGLHYAYQSEANDKLDSLHSVDLSVPF